MVCALIKFSIIVKLKKKGYFPEKKLPFQLQFHLNNRKYLSFWHYFSRMNVKKRMTIKKSCTFVYFGERESWELKNSFRRRMVSFILLNLLFLIRWKIESSVVQMWFIQISSSLEGFFKKKFGIIGIITGGICAAGTPVDRAPPLHNSSIDWDFGLVSTLSYVQNKKKNLSKILQKIRILIWHLPQRFYLRIRAFPCLNHF